MADKGKNVSRRDFAKLMAKGAVGLSTLPLIGTKLAGADEPAAGGASASTAKDARVCIVTSKTPIPKGDEAKQLFNTMLDEGIKAATGGKTPDEFMKASFKKDDRVAIKVNNYGFKGHRGPQLAAAICEKLQAAGLTPENILVYENSDGALSSARYKINFDGPGFRCYGTDRVGHMKEELKYGATTVRYSKIIEWCTAIINMPSLKAHNMAGVTICLKNHYGSIEDPRKYHANDCDPGIADINSTDIIKNKTRLCVCDATKILFAGGPEWLGQYTVDYNGILVSTDPVALDAIGNSLIKKFRKNSGMKQLPYNPVAKQIKTAQKNGIGVADLDRIELIEVSI